MSNCLVMKGYAEMLEIEEGKFYRTRDGRKVGPMKRRFGIIGEPFYPWVGYCDGTMMDICSNDISSEWVDEGPIVTVIKRELKIGVYGAVHLSKIYEDGVNIYANPGKWSANELREAAHLFNQIAEFLEEGK